jgi:phosphotransferase system  glucose/maltose/N-acetylglucosamine-specific IIC component
MTSNDGANLLTSVALIFPVYISSIVLREYFTDSAMDDVSRVCSSNRDVISAVTMILIAFIVLIVIFMPIMYTIHKYGECLCLTQRQRGTCFFVGQEKSCVFSHASASPLLLQ